MSDWFSPNMEDGTPRVYIGFHRPPFAQILNSFRESGATVMVAQGGGTIYTVQGMREAWERGEFDRLMYCDPADAPERVTA